MSDDNKNEEEQNIKQNLSSVVEADNENDGGISAVASGSGADDNKAAGADDNADAGAGAGDVEMARQGDDNNDDDDNEDDDDDDINDNNESNKRANAYINSPVIDNSVVKLDNCCSEHFTCLWSYLYNSMNGNYEVRLINLSCLFLLFVSFTMGHRYSMFTISSGQTAYCNDLKTFMNTTSITLNQTQINTVNSIDPELCNYYELLTNGYVVAFSGDVVIASTLVILLVLLLVFYTTLHRFLRYFLAFLVIAGAILLLSGTSCVLNAFVNINKNQYRYLNETMTILVGEMLLPVSLFVIFGVELFCYEIFYQTGMSGDKRESTRLSIYFCALFVVMIILVAGYASVTVSFDVFKAEYLLLAIGLSIVAVFGALFFIFYRCLLDKADNQSLQDSSFCQEKILRLVNSICFAVGAIVAFVGFLLIAIKIATGDTNYYNDIIHKPLFDTYVDQYLYMLYYLGYALLTAGVCEIFCYDVLMPDQ